MTWNDEDPNGPWRRPDAPAPPPPPPGSFGSAPPPPPPAGPPPPPGNPFGAAPVPGVPFAPAHFVAGKPPRPAIPVPGWLMVAGAVLVIVGTVLPWKTFGDVSINGFDEYVTWTDDGLIRQTPGGLFVFFAVVMLAFGITALAAGRVLAVVIIAIIVGAGLALFSAAEWAIYADNDGFVDGGDISFGIPVMLVGSLLALGGAIAGCAKRRR